MKIAETCIKHNVMTILTYILIVVFGFYCFQSLPLALMPEMELPVAIVYSTYAGAGPEDIEQQVTKPLESACAGLAGLDALTSTSAENMSMVIVQFDYGTDLDETLTDMRDKVDMVKSQLPEDASDPTVMSIDIDSMPVIMVALTGSDLATLQSRFGRITDLTVGLCGDLTFGRTVHSLIETLCRFGNVRFVLISPDELKTPQYVIDRINATDNCSYVEVRDLASVIGDLDVLYMTRVQKERFFNEDDYLRLRDTYILDEEKLQLAKPSMAVLHPLPRVNEIAVDVDDDPRAAYFEQVKNGMLVRMALESTVVGDELPGYEPLNPKEVQA